VVARLLLAAAAIAVLTTLVGLAIDGGPFPGEDEVMETFAESRTAALTTMAKSLTRIGSLAVLGPAVALAALWLVSRHRVRDAVWLAVVATGAVGLVNLVKVVVDRARPAGGGLVQVASASFPSQHAAQAAAILPALALFLVTGRRSRVLALAGALSLAAGVGLSRVYLGVHYPTDVLAGWALGGAWLAAVMAVRRRSR
jgi:undecaprenyl-diphosphatase